jgi:outer membrane lipoprotein-sorting protein
MKGCVITISVLIATGGLAIACAPQRVQGSFPFDTAESGLQVHKMMHRHSLTGDASDSADGQACSQQRLSGKDILLRSQKTYTGLRSFVGTVSVTSTASSSQLTIVQKATAKITFVRPDKIRIEGKTTPIYPSDPESGVPFCIASNGKHTWLAWQSVNKDTFEPATNITEAIDSMSGVTQNATKTIPALLLQLNGLHPDPSNMEKQFFEVFAEKAVVVDREVYNGRDCYRVVSHRPFGTWTFWVDAESFLLRRLESRQSNAQIRGYTASTSSNIQLKVNNDVFTIDALNINVDDKLFTPLK